MTPEQIATALRNRPRGKDYHELLPAAADLIESQAQRIRELEAERDKIGDVLARANGYTDPGHALVEIDALLGPVDWRKRTERELEGAAITDAATVSALKGWNVALDAHRASAEEGKDDANSR